MNKQPTILPPSSKQQQLCSHISKLSKKNIEALLMYNYIPSCSTCKSSLNMGIHHTAFNSQILLKLCMHCGSTFCFNETCHISHQNQAHFFLLNAQIKENPPPSLLHLHQQHQQFTYTYQIICRICGSVDSQAKMKFCPQKQQAQKKIIRFTQFVHQSLYKKLPKYLTTKFKQYEQLYSKQQIPVFGLKNLGNTCYLNSVLQVLFYTDILSQFYLDFQKMKNFNIISSQKKKRKQVQSYYEQIIEKYQSQNWHIVSDKKQKGKQKKLNQQKFVSQGLVKSSLFNLSFSKFIRNLKLFLSINENSQADQKQKIVYEPIQILKNLAQFDIRYDLKQEQDAQQLLIFLIDLLSQGEAICIFGKDMERKQKYKKVQSLLGRQKLSPVQQIFGSYLASHIICLSCNKESWVVDFTYHYPIPINENKTEQKEMKENRDKPIEDIKYYKQLYYPQKGNKSNFLSAMFKQQRLTNRQNYYSCQKCSGLSAMKKFYIVDSPQILIASFKRFEHNKRSKIAKYVKFQEQIDLNWFTLRQGDQQKTSTDIDTSCIYQLYGVIVHKGQTITSGHYISYVKIRINQENKQKNIWYQFSDQKIRKVTSKQVLKQQAYLVFYRRRSKR